jgi:hypothetical protein
LEEIVKKLFAALFLTISVFHLSAQNITFSGILDSAFSFSAAKGEVFLGVEEYANLRMQAKLRDRAAIFGAVNLIAAAGDYAANAALAAVPGGSSPISTTAFSAGENFIAAIELERLYFRLNFEAADFDGGLMRLPFGYGQVWGSSDFLNPKNPLKPDARPRAVLGAGLSWYPADELKVLGFGTAPRDPFSLNAKGWLTGISFDRHYDIASIQTLYSFETPKDGSNNGIHRAGFSLKADAIAGLVFDTLYTYNYEAGTGINGLSFSAGADYSYFDGNLMVLAEYLYNGKTSSTALGYGGYFADRHYLYTGGTWRFSDYTNMTAAFIFSFDEFSFTPLVTLSHDLFQGAVLTITAQLPMDSNTFSDDGSLLFNCSARLRLRF